MRAGVISNGGGRTARLQPAGWLALAAAPSFALMALLTGLDSRPAMLCSGDDAWPLTGMTAMYALMAAFHLPPWLKRVGSRAAR